MVFSIRGPVTLALAVVAAASLLLAPASASCVWSISPSPNQNLSKFGNELFGVSADSATDAWAVGYYAGSDVATLAEHWNGRSWQIFNSPSPNARPLLAGLKSAVLAPNSDDSAFDLRGAKARSPHTTSSLQTNADLQSVAALTPTNAWAVGEYYSNAGRSYLPLIEHWNGVNWSIAPSPAIKYGHLYGVKAISANDIWAVGRVRPAANNLTFTEHWNGSTWSVVPSPNAGSLGSVLNSVTATGPKDAWAVGFYTTAAGHDQTLSEHWNGSRWSVVPTPNATTVHANYLRSVRALSAKSAFAVGYYYDANLRLERTLAEQWNGSSWIIQPTSNEGNYQTALYDVAAVSPTEVMAVGLFFYPSGVSQTYAARWTGGGWMTTITPNVANYDALNGANSIPGTSDVWAVGGAYTGGGYSDKTLIERYHC